MPLSPAFSSALLSDIDLPAPLRSTLFFLLGLCGADHTTPPMAEADLARQMQKSRTTLYSHLVALRAYKGAVQKTYVSQGTIVFTFASWLFSDDQVPMFEHSNLPLKEEEELTNLNNLKDVLLLNAESSNIQISEPAQAPELPPEVVKELLAARIFPSLLPEIASYGRSNEDILALLAWAWEDQPKKPAPLFMSRLRNLAIPPDEFYGEACPVCKKYGSHADNCYRRFEIPVEDEEEEEES